MKVSICIPCYEQINYLQMTMESILVQTYCDYEIIISDDSKSDVVLNYINEVKVLFGDKLLYQRNNPPNGTPGNWNNVIEQANGDFIHLLHHDDYYSSPNSLKNMIDEASKCADVDVFVGEVLNYNGSSKTITSLVVDDSYLRALRLEPCKILFANLLGPPSIIFLRKSALIHFDVHLKWLVDIEYYYRLFKANKNWVYTRKPFVTSVNNAEHNVTNKCESNAEVEIYEYTYLFNRVIRGFFISCRFLILISRLFVKHGLFSIDEVIKLCRSEKKPLVYYAIIKWLRIKYFFKAN
jgi:glycosyltransferase involved in cell wall biosynthesis